MIFNQWNDIIGKTVIGAKHYIVPSTYKHFGEPEDFWCYYQWVALIFPDGIIVHEYENKDHEVGDVALIDTIKERMPQELKDLINQYK